MDKAVEDKVKGLAKDVQAHLPCSYVYLFGSHAKGCPHPGSDIDVAVLIPEVPGREEDPRRILQCNALVWSLGLKHSPLMSTHVIEADHERSGLMNNVLDTGICVASPKSAENELLPDTA